MVRSRPTHGVGRSRYVTLAELCRAALAQTLFAPTSLPAALRRFGFVQADPIRAPARAQDLILRHRVNDYRAGDLERRYPQLDIDEAYVYAYGFVSRTTADLIHPPATLQPTVLEKRVLAVVREHGPLHPADMQRWFGRGRISNDWGGVSLETTRTLERLRRLGFVRVARRDAGIRVYEATAPRPAPSLSAEARTRRLIGVVAEILAPIPERTLSGIAAKLVRRTESPIGHRPLMRAMLDDGEYVREEIAGLTYWRTPRAKRSQVEERVRLLAPFDPIVWDRRRFEHVWRWEYRFEAYVPSGKRVRGYYALPLLWREDVIGWANVRVVRGTLQADFGYVRAKPKENAFKRELEAEVEALRTFLVARP